LKMCPNIPNFLKIAEKHFSHQNKYFWPTKTCFKRFW
jgi:hypothetical protein